jgi:hypothetical protein
VGQTDAYNQVENLNDSNEAMPSLPNSTFVPRDGTQTNEAFPH